ncbi:MAG: methyltransferase domain-containing protein [Candidatus Aegiribacteria sp.]
MRRKVLGSIVKLLPAEARDHLRSTVGKLRGRVYAGSNYECPCCGGRFRKMIPWDPSDPLDDNMVCPACRSQSRHRLLLTFLERETDIFSSETRLLHFAPESFLADRFRKYRNIEYVTADLSMARVSARLDITSLPFENDSFDALICNHVLEHVMDDSTAIRELSRVLRPGGWAVVMVPMDRSRAETFEDPSITDPEKRLKTFGQSDHVRIYGRDFIQRLRSGSWTVRELNYAEDLDPGLRDRLALMKNEFIYTASKQPTKGDGGFYFSEDQ